MYFQDGSLPDLERAISVEAQNPGPISPSYDYIQRVELKKQVIQQPEDRCLKKAD